MPVANDTTEKTGEPSRINCQMIEDDTELSAIVVQKKDADESSLMNDWMKEKLKELEGYFTDEKASNVEATIQRVPPALRRADMGKFFRGMTIAFGPYQYRSFFYDDRNYGYKCKLAAMFIKEHIVVDKETVCLKIRMETENLRRCYKQDDETVKEYNDDELAWMFFIDGCSVLRHIYFTAYQMGHENTDMYYHVDHSEFTEQLILLENQLPFRVLELLINSCDKIPVMRKSVQLFVHKIGNMVGRDLEDETLELLQETPLHLLDLICTSFIQPVRAQQKFGFRKQILEKFGMLLDILLRLVHDIMLSDGNDNLSFHPSFYSVEMLKAAGIKFRPSSTRSLTDISFSSGTLKLPPIFVDQLTATIFMNMAAYEMTAATNKIEVSFYIFLLASLISQPQDVKELRDNGILYNNLVSDEEVVKVFKEMSVVPVLSGQYSDILSQIWKHCEKRHNVWLAQLKYQYFESPWTAFALLGAVIALCFTFLQTLYSVLGYYNQ